MCDTTGSERAEPLRTQRPKEGASVSLQDNRITLIFIVNGVDYRVNANVEAPLTVAVQHALVESGNTGRPANEWEVRNSSGVLLEQNRTIEDLHLQDGARLFLSLHVGAGGIRNGRS